MFLKVCISDFLNFPGPSVYHNRQLVGAEQNYQPVRDKHAQAINPSIRPRYSFCSVDKIMDQSIDQSTNRPFNRSIYLSINRTIKC